MKIEKDYETNGWTNASDIMEMCMSEIQELTQYEPTNDEDGAVWGMIAITLRIIAEKATCYEEMVEQGANQSFFKN